MKSYLDSSFLFSLYAPDAHSAAAAGELARARGQLVLSWLSELELLNALDLRVFRKELRREQVEQAHAAFAEDVRRGVFAILDLDRMVFLRAQEIVLQTTRNVGCRTADILHLAAALEAGATKLLTFDERQKQLASRLKLPANRMS